MVHRKFKQLLLATGNKGKIDEFVELLCPLGLTLLTLADFAELPAPEEDGHTFADNAAIKATYYSRHSSEWVIADDSGLEIDSLGGSPGVHSARFGGDGLTYYEKMKLILANMDSVEDRQARFVCVIKLADPSGNIKVTATGICEGSIARAPCGTNGFGYDPIFVPAGYERTFGELSEAEKRAISHRGKASAELISRMLDFTGV